MNKNIAVLLTLILVFLASYFLYWQGEVTLKNATKNFTTLAFETTSSKCNNNSLSFFIENNLEKENSYQISISGNKKSLENFTINIPAQNKKLIQPQKETLASLCSVSEQIKYEIIINDKSQKQSIYKLINL